MRVNSISKGRAGPLHTVSGSGHIVARWPLRAAVCGRGCDLCVVCAAVDLDGGWWMRGARVLEVERGRGGPTATCNDLQAP